ncbi:MAG: hypothetical protein JRF36_00355 [Deltaproteobacteria bacterium]|nr:hypothetical protein [Deltaproteobacteria bacterium]MBW2517539.1 hypothetical protein [Deltaproteobacteria bacterium]
MAAKILCPANTTASDIKIAGGRGGCCGFGPIQLSVAMKQMCVITRTALGELPPYPGIKGRAAFSIKTYIMYDSYSLRKMLAA